jgi:hypothetical protein
MVKVKIKGQERDAELVSNVCYQIPTKDQNKKVVIGRVKVTDTRGKPVVRFAQILDSNACKSTHILNRKTNKLVIGKRELPKLFRLVSGATPKAPAYIPGKLLAAMANKQARKQKKQQQTQQQTEQQTQQQTQQ